MYYAANNNGDEAVIQLFDKFIEEIYLDYLPNTSLEQLRLDIIQGYHQMRENDLGGNSREMMKIPVVPKEQLEPHFSCKMGKNEALTTQETCENNISQSDLKQNLAIVEKDNIVLNFFADNKCS